ncbi:hypothetical protein VCHA34P126_140039 [Vibrio chagasii]|nr:hypothetical protein VCHA34P126_140039 [Vibrio chagasii]CAH7024846.1 hypothetical protein VCHA41O247_160006 [Vibrio chagasii]CAH7247343.1 hypothetical protein VCHA50P420_160091 [Vibrio chagasii]
MTNMVNILISINIRILIFNKYNNKKNDK